MAKLYCSLLIALQALLLEAQPSAQPERCLKPRPENTGCASLKVGSSPITFWYFDTPTRTCLAAASDDRLVFGDHDSNVFKSWLDCVSACMPSDAPLCSPNGSPAQDTETEGPIVCARQPGPAAEHGECPDGYRCQNAAFFAVCCNITAEDEYERNVRPFCAGNKKAILTETSHTAGGGGVPQLEMPLLGRRCADGHCPAGAKCVQLSLFAHCCEPDPLETNHVVNKETPAHERGGCPRLSEALADTEARRSHALNRDNDNDVHLRQVVMKSAAGGTTLVAAGAHLAAGVLLAVLGR